MSLFTDRFVSFRRQFFLYADDYRCHVITDTDGRGLVSRSVGRSTAVYRGGGCVQCPLNTSDWRAGPINTPLFDRITNDCSQMLPPMCRCRRWRDEMSSRGLLFFSWIVAGSLHSTRRRRPLALVVSLADQATQLTNLIESTALRYMASQRTVRYLTYHALRRTESHWLFKSAM